MIIRKFTLQTHLNLLNNEHGQMGSALGVTSCEIQTSKYFYSASLLEYELHCNLYLYLYHFLFCICTYSARQDNAADCIGNGTYLPQCPWVPPGCLLGAPCKAAAPRIRNILIPTDELSFAFKNSGPTDQGAFFQLSVWGCL